MCCWIFCWNWNSTCRCLLTTECLLLFEKYCTCFCIYCLLCNTKSIKDVHSCVSLNIKSLFFKNFSVQLFELQILALFNIYRYIITHVIIAICFLNISLLVQIDPCVRWMTNKHVYTFSIAALFFTKHAMTFPAVSQWSFPTKIKENKIHYSLNKIVYKIECHYLYKQFYFYLHFCSFQ